MFSVDLRVLKCRKRHGRIVARILPEWHVISSPWCRVMTVMLFLCLAAVTRPNKNNSFFLKKKHLFYIGYAFSKRTWSRLINYVLGPRKSDSSSKTTCIVLFPGLNSQIQVKIPQHVFFNWFWTPSCFFLIGSSG